jgi:hypothetical protein
MRDGWAPETVRAHFVGEGFGGRKEHVPNPRPHRSTSNQRSCGGSNTDIDLHQICKGYNTPRFLAHPLKFHRDEKNLWEARKKWVSLIGLHHMEYQG